MDRFERDNLYSSALRLFDMGCSQRYIASKLEIRIATICDWFKQFRVGYRPLKRSGNIIGKSKCKEIKEYIEIKIIGENCNKNKLNMKKIYYDVIKVKFRLNFSYRTFYNYLRKWDLTKYSIDNISKQLIMQNLELDKSRNAGIEINQIPITLFKSFFYSYKLPDKIFKLNNDKVFLWSEAGYSSYYSGLFLNQKDLDLLLYLINKSDENFSVFNINIENICKYCKIDKNTLIISLAKLKNELIIFKSNKQYIKTSFIQGYIEDFRANEIRELKLQSELKDVFSNNAFFLSNEYINKRLVLKNNLSKWLQWLMISYPSSCILVNELRRLAKGSCFYSRAPTNKEFELAFKELKCAGFICSYYSPTKIVNAYSWIVKVSK